MATFFAFRAPTPFCLYIARWPLSRLANWIECWVRSLSVFIQSKYKRCGCGWQTAVYELNIYWKNLTERHVPASKKWHICQTCVLLSLSLIFKWRKVSLALLSKVTCLEKQNIYNNNPKESNTWARTWQLCRVTLPKHQPPHNTCCHVLLLRQKYLTSWVKSRNLPFPPRSVGVDVKEAKAGQTATAEEARFRPVEEVIEVTLEQRAGIEPRERTLVGSDQWPLGIATLRCTTPVRFAGQWRGVGLWNWKRNGTELVIVSLLTRLLWWNFAGFIFIKYFQKKYIAARN